MATETLKEELSFYGGQVKIIFYPNSYSYRHPGERCSIDSASKIANYKDKGDNLLTWASECTASSLIRQACDPKFDIKLFKKGLINIDKEEVLNLTFGQIIESINAREDEKQKACDIGSAVHDYAEAYGKAMIHMQDAPKPQTETLSEPQKAGIQAFQNWVLEHNVEFIACEKRLYSREWDAIGITDLIAIVDDRKMIIDYKTSSGVYREAKIQGCSYRKMYLEEYGEKLGVGIAHFDKETGGFEFVVLTDQEIELLTELADSHNKALKIIKKHEKLNK